MTTSIGAYVDGTAKGVTQFEDWLGRGVDFVVQHMARSDWWDYDNSAQYFVGLVSQLNKPIYWTIPMFANGGTLAEAADGAYKDHWAKAAAVMLAARPNDAEIVVRFGEEFNGNWMPWAGKGKEGDFIAAYRAMVDTFRSVSDKFTFAWNVNLGNHGMDPAKGYPGDSYVDYITADMYYDTAWDPKDPSAAFDYMLKRDYGLNWFAKFADAHNKPMGFPEWGVLSSNAGPFIEKFAAWMETHDVAYQSYWDSNSGFAGKLSGGAKDGTGSAFIDAFADSNDGHNVLPTGTADRYVVQENMSFLVAAAAGVLHNDTDANGDHLTAMLVDGPEHGTLSLRADGSLIYTPDTNYSGADAFTYVPRDGDGAGDLIKVALTVVDSNDASVSGRAVSWTMGTAADDTLAGDARNNSLDGGTGRDTMIGGRGDDTYTVNQSDDVVTEYANQGIDTIVSWAKSYMLSANVENLVLKGTNQTGTGNGLANGLTGGAGADILNGKGGNDWLTGGGGSDTFVFERGAGHDIVRDFSTIGAQQDIVKLVGLDYSSFTDVRADMVQVASDVRLDLADGSTVTFLKHKIADFTAKHFGLPATGDDDSSSRPEPLAKSGVAASWYYGESGDDVLTGDRYNNHLNGGAGQDIALGGKGDDTYNVENDQDKVVEHANEGTDTVETWGNYTLAANVENLEILGVSVKGTGNELDNLIVGGEGNDTLNGKAGDDWLTGGAGRDTFVFEKGGHDVITDFATSGSTDDAVHLIDSGYANFAQVKADMTQVGADVLLTISDGNSINFLNHKITDFVSQDFLLT